MTTAVVWIVSYLIGSIPFGWLLARLRGVDIQRQGSGNIGATNVGRVLGKPLGAVVFVCDFLKGAVPAAMSGMLATSWGDLGPAGTLEAGAGLAAILGHVFPITLGFRGGKGVATAAGAVSVLLPIPAISGLLAFVAIVSATRCVSLACLSGVVALDVLYVMLEGFDLAAPRLWFATAASILIFARHAGNIQRLLAGEERQIKEHRILAPTARSLHVLSLGLWCGAAVFFSFVAAPSLFDTFGSFAKSPAEDRPWLPTPEVFAAGDRIIDRSAEQGSRLAGKAVGGIFPKYFLWQYLCGVVALGTALAWPKLRPGVMAVALVLVVAGWAVEKQVERLRVLRSESTDAYLRAAPGDRDAAAAKMVGHRSHFGAMHGVSLLINFGVIGLALVGLILAGNLPLPRTSTVEGHVPKESGPPPAAKIRCESDETRES